MTQPPPPNRHRSGSDRRIIDNNGPDLRVYQAWRGSNIFCFGGRLIFGPDARSLFLTVFLIVTPVILFCAFVSHELISEFQPHFGNFVVVVCAIFTAYVIILLFLTSSQDPGIIPRNLNPSDGDGSSISTDWQAIHGVGSSLPPMKDVLVNGIVVKIKYCQTCMLYRPPRCSHCSVCNNSVERFDHHCPWVGQCIGKTTYENFRYRHDGKMNPYNLGCVNNIIDIFFSKVSKSRTVFREKI
ncbi:hypothetical protein GH714_007346 [Hevea brasiliensis]|uniref:S-acyltransferase n=1 Tax=Hevea brasiliensis TaxID=3981 RepID=A0A6A6KJ15_HEVBR|nr:hypothetical protein GH714_007346 [Hevea brasiliensis]